MPRGLRRNEVYRAPKYRCVAFPTDPEPGHLAAQGAQDRILRLSHPPVRDWGSELATPLGQERYRSRQAAGAADYGSTTLSAARMAAEPVCARLGADLEAAEKVE